MEVVEREVEMAEDSGADKKTEDESQSVKDIDLLTFEGKKLMRSPAVRFSSAVALITAPLPIDMRVQAGVLIRAEGEWWTLIGELI